MTQDLKAFWQRFQSGIEIAVAEASSEELLGVRDGFIRYFHECLRQPVPIAVVPHDGAGSREPSIAVSDAEGAQRAAAQAARLEAACKSDFHFYVCTEGAIHGLEVAGETRYFVRSWTAIRSPAGEALGGSSSIGLPRGLWSEDQAMRPASMPGKRRRGGLISSLTGGLERRRSAVHLASFNALATLFYGVFEPPKGIRR